MSAHTDHMAPLRALVKGLLHRDRDLHANVIRLRWRRKRKSAEALPTEGDAAQPQEVQP